MINKDKLDARTISIVTQDHGSISHGMHNGASRDIQDISLSFLFEWTTQAAIVSLVLLSAALGRPILSYIALFLSIVYCIFRKLDDYLPLLVSLSAIESSFTLNGISAIVFLLMVLIIKAVVKKGLWKPYRKLAPGIVLIGLECIGELRNTGVNGSMLCGIVLVCFFYMLFSEEQYCCFNSMSFIIHFGTSFLLIAAAMVYLYGGFDGFVSAFASATNASVRFGSDDAVVSIAGGAMGIPLYASLILSLSAVALSGESRQSIGKLQMVIVMILDIVAILFGFLTLSRIFFVCAGIALVCTLLLQSSARGWAKITFVLLVVLAISMMVFGDTLLHSVDMLLYRINQDVTGTGTRNIIWKACSAYLLDNPTALFFGEGSYGYQFLASKFGLLFRLGTHNYYLDMLMSWGILGFASVLTICQPFARIRRCWKRGRNIDLLPFIVVSVFAMTALRTNSLKPLVFFYAAFACMGDDRRSAGYQ